MLADTVPRSTLTADAWAACHALTARQCADIPRDDGTIEHAWIDPLAEQLTTAAYPSNEQKGGSGGGGKPGSRPPVNLDAVALFDEVARACRARRPGTIAANLADLIDSATIGVTGLEPRAAVLDWTRKLQQWRGRIEQITGADAIRIRPLPIPCPSCGVRWVEQLEGDEQPVRTDAVFVEFHGDALQAFGCHACRDVWKRGGDLDSLVAWALDTAA